MMMKICGNPRVYETKTNGVLKASTFSSLHKFIHKFHIPHLIHCIFFIVGFVMFDYYIGKGYKVFLPYEESIATEVPLINKLASYLNIFLILPLLPTIIFTVIGLLFFDVCQNEVKLKIMPSKAPFICFRYVTRGHYYDLIQNNVDIVEDLCLKTGMRKFVIHVATETELPLKKSKYVHQTVIPKDYVPKSGAMFKARVLQYCLEDGVDFLNEHDWIVHLDEETKATENSIRGILNFVCDGKYHFGQGLIIFMEENNLFGNFVQFMDTWRIADQLGKQRCQMNILHRLVLEWKGSFFISLAGAEKAISFDHGPESSLTEDGYFGFLATKLGYKFKFIEGEMYELSPMTIWDMVNQRKRWITGGLAIIRSAELPWRTKFIFAVSVFGILASFCGFLPVFLRCVFPLPYPSYDDLVHSFLLYFTIYFHNFGVAKSFSYFKNCNFLILCVALFVNTVSIIPNCLLTALSTLLALFSDPKEFYIVKKE